MVKIVTAEHLPNSRVRLVFDDGVEGAADFSEAIRKGGVCSPMVDPAFFARVEVGPRGRSLCWPGDVDFCADALYLQVAGITYEELCRRDKATNSKAAPSTMGID